MINISLWVLLMLALSLVLLRPKNKQKEVAQKIELRVPVVYRNAIEHHSNTGMEKDTIL